MPLAPIEPFNFENFLLQAALPISEIANGFENHQRGPWGAALERYNFGGAGYEDGQAIRERFHQDIHNANGQEAICAISNEILDWGNMRPLNDGMRGSLLDSLGALDAMDGDVLLAICADRIASMSKIYEMWNPAEWVIFDSYCAKGLQWMVSEFVGEITPPLEAMLIIPWPPGRVGAPHLGFPRLGSLRQARLGFIYTSWLCRAIADLLNTYERQHHVWQAYKIEMVAFQIGHEI